MQCWEILGIKPTHNKAIIKRAYSARLKENHPEDNSAGFQQVTEAYKTAIHLAKHFIAQTNTLSRVVTTADAETSTVSQNTRPGASECPVLQPGPTICLQQDELSAWSYKSDNQHTRDTPQDPCYKKQANHCPLPDTFDSTKVPCSSLADIFLTRLKTIYTNESTRNCHQSWQQLLCNRDLDNIELKELLRYEVFKFCDEIASENQRQPAPFPLKPEILQLLDQVFGWQSDEISLLRQFNPTQVDRVMKHIQSDTPFARQELSPSLWTIMSGIDQRKHYGWMFIIATLIALIVAYISHIPPNVTQAPIEPVSDKQHHKSLHPNQ